MRFMLRSSGLIDIGVETTHWNLTTMQTVFSVAMEKLCPEEQDKALALLPFSRQYIAPACRSLGYCLLTIGRSILCRYLWSGTVRDIISLSHRLKADLIDPERIAYSSTL